jgi:asparagine synthase (glutamine-hydrolysing)
LKPGVSGIKMNQLLQLEDGDVPSTFPIARQMAPPDHIAKLLNFEMPADSVSKIVQDALSGNGDLGVLSKISIAEITTYMQNVLLRDTDQFSMASALEVRVPFIDYTLVEYVMGISDEYKNPVYPKKLLVDSLGDLLPEEIVHRKKMGFTFPFDSWIRNELKEFCNDRIVSLSKRSFLNGHVILDRWNRFLNNDKAIRWPDIWIGVVLENWLLENNVQS